MQGRGPCQVLVLFGYVLRRSADTGKDEEPRSRTLVIRTAAPNPYADITRAQLPVRKGHPRPQRGVTIPSEQGGGPRSGWMRSPAWAGRPPRR